MLPPERTTTVVPDGAGATCSLHERRDPDRAGTLDDELRPLQQQHDRVGDRVLVDLDHVVDQAARAAAR